MYGPPGVGATSIPTTPPARLGEPRPAFAAGGPGQAQDQCFGPEARPRERPPGLPDAPARISDAPTVTVPPRYNLGSCGAYAHSCEPEAPLTQRRPRHGGRLPRARRASPRPSP